MSKVIIHIEDKLDGNVSVTATPTFETMAMKMNSGNELTSAEAYALFVLRQIREQSKAQGKLQLKIPQLGR